MDLKDVERLIISDNKEGFLGIVHFGYRSLLCNLCIKVNGVTYSRAVAQIFIESMTEFCQITVNSIFRRIAAYDGPSVNSPPIAQKTLGIAFAGEAVPFNPVPNIPTSNLTKGQIGALLKIGLGAGLIIGGTLTLPEGTPFIAAGIPMFTEGLTLDVVEFGFHGDTSNITSTWEIFGTAAEQIYNLNNPCPVK